jgi:hypothetical protein
LLIIIKLALLYDSTGRVGLDYKLSDWLILSKSDDPKKTNKFSKIEVIRKVGFLCPRKIHLEGNRKHIKRHPNQFVLKIVSAVPKTVQIVPTIQTTFKKELTKGGNRFNERLEENKRKWRKSKEWFILALLYDSIGRVGWGKNSDENGVSVENLKSGSGTGPLYKYLRYESPTEVGAVTEINVLDTAELINTDEDADVSSKSDDHKGTNTLSKPEVITKVEFMYQKGITIITLPKKVLTVHIIQITVKKELNKGGKGIGEELKIIGRKV